MAAPRKPVNRIPPRDTHVRARATRPLAVDRLPKIRKNPSQQKKRAKLEARARARAERAARATRIAAAAATNASEEALRLAHERHAAVRQHIEARRREREKRRAQLRLQRNKEGPGIDLDEQMMAMDRLEAMLFGPSRIRSFREEDPPGDEQFSIDRL